MYVLKNEIFYLPSSVLGGTLLRAVLKGLPMKITVLITGSLYPQTKNIFYNKFKQIMCIKKMYQNVFKLKNNSCCQKNYKMRFTSLIYLFRLHASGCRDARANRGVTSWTTCHAIR